MIKAIKTKEHLLYLMQSGYMRLSTFDLDFVQNLSWSINQKNEITSNQSDLFDKIVIKYKRQLLKQNINESLIKNLSWKCNVRISDPLFTNAYISIENKQIKLKAPHKKKVVQALSLEGIFKWNKLKSVYEADYSAIHLKYIVDIATKFYPVVNYCDVTSKLLNKLAEYNDVKVWNPTLYKTNSGLFCVMAANQYLMESIQDIQFDLSIPNISSLAAAGISIDKSVIGDNPDENLSFASKYIVDAEWSDLDSVIDKLYMIGCDCVIANALLASYSHILKKKFKNENFTYIDGSFIARKIHLSETAKKPVVIVTNTLRASKIRLFGVHKVIVMKDSTPIKLF